MSLPARAEPAELRRRAGPTPEALLPRDAAAFRRLVAWLQDGGAVLNALALHGAAGGERGVHAAGPIAAGDALLIIPRRFILTCERAAASPIGREITSARIPGLEQQVVLAAFLLVERRACGSFFRPFLDMLPASHAHIPILFDSRRLAWLEGSLTIGMITDKRAALHREYRLLRDAVPGFAGFSYLDYVWARITTASRVFGLTIDGKSTDAMVPLADLMNHAPGAGTRWAFDDAHDGFVVHAAQDFRTGDPIHESYGTKSNSRFFVSYGFCVERNPDDEAMIEPALDGEDPLHERKRRFLRKRWSIGFFQVPAMLRHPVTRALFTFLRVTVADEAELSLIERAPPRRPRHVPPVSARNEAAALRLLADCCRRALAAFPTTAAEDDALLATELPPWARSCVMMRRSEKRVLRFYLALTEAAAPLFDLPRAALDEVLATKFPRGHRMRPYLAGVVARLAAAG